MASDLIMNPKPRFDNSLVDRIRKALTGTRAVIEREAHGGAFFLSEGNPFIGAFKNSLVVRIGAHERQRALTKPNVESFGLRELPNEWVLVSPRGLLTEDQLSGWIGLAINFLSTLATKEHAAD